MFYDTNEQHRILAENIEDYLAPIYRSEAKYVICLLSSSYPSRIWTKFESDQFKERFGDHSVIPIRFKDALPGMLDEAAKVGGMSFDSSKEMDSQAKVIVQLLTRKLGE